jgi:hypothetical protein
MPIQNGMKRVYVAWEGLHLSRFQKKDRYSKWGKTSGFSPPFFLCPSWRFHQTSHKTRLPDLPHNTTNPPTSTTLSLIQSICLMKCFDGCSVFSFGFLSSAFPHDHYSTLLSHTYMSSIFESCSPRGIHEMCGITKYSPKAKDILFLFLHEKIRISIDRLFFCNWTNWNFP